MAGSFGDLLAKAGLKAGAPVEVSAGSAGTGEGEPPAAKALPSRLAVRYGKKGRSRKATVVSGLGVEHHGILARLQAELGVGGRVDGDDLVLQGDQTERVARWLESQGVAEVRR